ncbi:MAG: GNAT family N-acetyltransferase [Pseudomonadota bacterium]
MAESASITIRSYRPDDDDALLGLVRELQGHERVIEPLMIAENEIGPEYIARLESQIKSHGGDILIADDGGTPVGYAALYLNVPSDDEDEIPHTYALVADVAVTASHRCRGLGKRLLAACEDRARSAGAERFRIFVLSQNQHARTLYGTFGFKERVTEMEKSLK